MEALIYGTTDGIENIHNLMLIKFVLTTWPMEIYGKKADY